ncbi:methyltransferase domain-containing protein [Nocardioides sp. BGMRC 2183]|nr:methyltransferase domain-containing protein [Nocardioides sp. BGMRC 2183]
MALRRTTGPSTASPRTAVVWDVLDAALDGSPRRIVDIGGGTGGSAVRLAAAGHQVSVVDPSPDALAALARRAGELGVEVDGRQGDVASLVDLVGVESADVVLCHGVLEVVDATAALAAIRRVLRPGGQLSLLVAQRDAAVLARAMAGHFQQAIALLQDGIAADGRRGRRYTADEIGELATSAGFEVLQTHGIRVFADHVPAALLDLEPGASASLVELERAAAPRSDFHSLATQLHLLCVRS